MEERGEAVVSEPPDEGSSSEAPNLERVWMHAATRRYGFDPGFPAD